MKIYEILTEDDLTEFRTLKRITNRLIHSNNLKIGTRAFKRLIRQGIDSDSARHQASQIANVGERELQEYLKDLGLLPA